MQHNIQNNIYQQFLSSSISPHGSDLQHLFNMSDFTIDQHMAVIRNSFAHEVNICDVWSTISINGEVHNLPMTIGHLSHYDDTCFRLMHTPLCIQTSFHVDDDILSSFLSSTMVTTHFKNLNKCFDYDAFIPFLEDGFLCIRVAKPEQTAMNCFNLVRPVVDKFHSRMEYADYAKLNQLQELADQRYNVNMFARTSYDPQ